VCRENWPAVKTLLLAWFDCLEESFSHKEVQFKKLCLPVKTSCHPAKNVKETPAISIT